MDKEEDHTCTTFKEKSINVQTTEGSVVKTIAYECSECSTMFLPQHKADIIKVEPSDSNDHSMGANAEAKLQQLDAKKMIPLNVPSGQVAEGVDSAEDTPGKLADSLIDTLSAEDVTSVFSDNNLPTEERSTSDEERKVDGLETPANVFSCKHCENTVLFTSLSTMFQHYREVHKLECTPDDLVSYICYVCNNQFNTQKELDNHLHAKCDTIIPFVCKHCDRRYNTSEHLKQHLQNCKPCKLSHLEENPFDMMMSSFECSVCKTTFASQQNLVEHHRSQHIGEKIHRCPHCDASFSWPENLDRHMNIHQGSPSKTKAMDSKLRCKVCSNPFHSIVSLSSHMSLSHPDHPFTLDGTWGFKDLEGFRPPRSKPVRTSAAPAHSAVNMVTACDEDLSDFVAELANNAAKKRKLDSISQDSNSSNKYGSIDLAHEVIAVSDEAVSLEEIGAGSDDIVIIEEDDIGVHKLVNAVAAQNDPNSLYCNICDKLYRDASSDTKLAMSLRCNHCGWTFTKGYQLEAHIDHLHAQDILQSVCRVCDSTLKNNTEMDRHYAKDHSQSRVFHCYQCESIFNTKSCLRGHLLRHQATKGGKGSGDHVCPHCNMRYAHAHQLLTHVTKSHQAFVPKPGVIGDLNTMFVCGFCSKKFTYEGSLKIHLKQHEEKIKAQVLASGGSDVIQLK